jgi:hypothetical protein
MLDRHQHILLKLRVIPMAFGILQHQGQLGNDIFQIMDDKSRHPVESIELPYFEQRLRGLQLPEKGAGLAACRLQQIVDFPIDVDPGPRRCQDDESPSFTFPDASGTTSQALGKLVSHSGRSSCS